MSTPRDPALSVVRALNEMLECDRHAISELVETRISCNDALADGPYVFVASPTLPALSRQPMVGLLGVINGLLVGALDSGQKIQAVYDDKDDQTILSFRLTPSAPCAQTIFHVR